MMWCDVSHAETAINHTYIYIVANAFINRNIETNNKFVNGDNRIREIERTRERARKSETVS